MILADVGMLAVASNRTKMYLQGMANCGLLPACVLYLEDPAKQTPEQIALSTVSDRSARLQLPEPSEFDLNVTVPELLHRYAIPYERIPSLDPNSEAVVESVARCAPSILIYSGPGGAILRSRILGTAKRFLHIHPGYVPHYRGSTTLYYSLLNERHCGATAFFLEEQVDAGPVIRRRKYPPPADRTTIDMYYDPHLRTQLLLEVLKEYKLAGHFPTQSQDAEGETYFIIHPVLKHIAILGR